MLLYDRKYNDASRAICAGHHASYEYIIYSSFNVTNKSFMEAGS